MMLVNKTNIGGDGTKGVKVGRQGMKAVKAVLKIGRQGVNVVQAGIKIGSRV